MRNNVLTSKGGKEYFEYKHSLNYYLNQSFEKYGENIAYVFEDEILAYNELNNLANIFADTLLREGVQKGDIVFIALQNSLELPIAYLACIKIGAIFTPIDLKWPKKRMQILIETVLPKCIVSHSNSIFDKSIIIDLEILKKQSLPLQDVSVESQPEDPVYGFFTSGSTGIPKCTININKGLVNRFMYMDKVFQIKANDDVVLQNSNIAFDSSLWQLLWPLMSGCKIIIPKSRKYLDFNATVSLIEKHKITMTDFVPSIFTLLMDSIEADNALIDKLSSLKSIIIGGEESHVELINRFFALFPKIKMVNTYGHTEASIGMVFYEMTEKVDTPRIPLGLPIDNTYVIIANENLEPVEVGETGEILVGGVCIGNGYYKNDIKNSETFVANPFSFIPGSKIYKTGDYGYIGEDGLLYYKGRRDAQIKIGGVRIELSEIEQACRSLDGVENIKAVFNSEKQTINLFVKSNVEDKDALKRILLESIKKKLPKNAIPSKIVILKDFPLNDNGKTDIQKLNSILLNNNKQVGKEKKSLKIKVVALMKEVLEIEQLNEGADFFELGGTSILALKFILKLEKEFKTTITLEALYNNFTVEEIVSQLESNQNGVKKIEESQQAKERLFIKDYLDLTNYSFEQNIAENRSQNRGVLLTGTTGCFGTQLLYDLLKETDYTIYCLVRGEDIEYGYQKIERSLKKYELFDSNLIEDRIVPILGDLSKDYWGLEVDIFNDLTRKVGFVIYNAAEVDFVKKYDGLKRTNVLSLRYLLQFCTKNDLKQIHYISSISVLSEKMFEYYGVVPEKILYDFNYMPSGGYNQSKWLAEKILSESRNLNIPVSIYRFGEITANTKTGIANDKSLLDMFIKAIVYLKCYPASNLRIDYFPADVAGKLVVNNLNQDNLEVNAVNISGFSITEFAELLVERSITLQKINYKEFYLRLSEAASEYGSPEYLQTLMFLIPNLEDAKTQKDPVRSIFFKKLNKVSVRNLANSKRFDQNRLNDFESYINRVTQLQKVQ